MTNNPLFSRKLFLRVALKILTAIAALWIVYVLTAGFFPVAKKSDAVQHKFDLSSLEKDRSIYFKINDRELLVINSQNRYVVYWAQDPIYGCRLEFSKVLIKPVCINIEYSLNGNSTDNKQQLLLPEYEITPQKKLIIR